MQLSIVQKISAITLALVITSSSIVAALIYQQERDLLVRHALENYSSDAENQAHKIELQINELSSDSLLLSFVPPIQGIIRSKKAFGIDPVDESTVDQWKARLDNIFKVFLNSKDQYIEAAYIDEQGNEIVKAVRSDGVVRNIESSQLGNISFSSTYRDLSTRLRASRFYSRIVFNSNNDDGHGVPSRILEGAVPVYNEYSGEFSGLIILNMDLSPLFDEIKESVEDYGRNIYITNEYGEYLLGPDRGGGIVFFEENFNRLLQEDHPLTETLFTADNNQNHMTLLPNGNTVEEALVIHKMAISNVDEGGFITIGIGQPYYEIVAEAVSVLNKVFLAIGVLVTFVAICFVFMSIRLVRPIKQMTKAFIEYQSGSSSSVSVDLPLNRNDEMGRLALGFIALIKQTDDAKAELRSMNQNLERMIQERTEELKRNKIRQEVIVQNIVDGLISIDEKGVIQDFNRAAETIFGYSSNEVIGQKINILMPESYSVEHDGYMDAYHKSGEAKIIGKGREVVGRRKDGSTFPLDLAINEIWFGDQRIYSGIVRDITERKRIDKMKNEFVSTVSHELRTPLTAIRGSIGLLLGNALGHLPEKAGEMMEIASANTERLLILINDLLDIQKIESGKMEFKFDYFSVTDFLDKALQMHKAYGEQFNVDFVISHVVEAYLYSDEDRLMQVLGNLMSNAAKFSPSGGVVEISVTRIDDGQLRIEVKDHGPGISDDDKELLFTQFSQVDSSDSRKKGGTGLGLAISRAILNNLSGTIGVDSILGRGSIFYVELPECENCTVVDKKFV